MYLVPLFIPVQQKFRECPSSGSWLTSVKTSGFACGVRLVRPGVWKSQGSFVVFVGVVSITDPVLVGLPFLSPTFGVHPLHGRQYSICWVYSSILVVPRIKSAVGGPRLPRQQRRYRPANRNLKFRNETKYVRRLVCVVPAGIHQQSGRLSAQ